MLYLVELHHSPEKCPGVSNEVRDWVLRMSASMAEVLQTHGCKFEAGWVSKSAHVTFTVIDALNAHALDDAIVDLGLAVWNTTTIYPLITLQEAVEGQAGR
jgi:hypothetical protein